MNTPLPKDIYGNFENIYKENKYEGMKDAEYILPYIYEDQNTEKYEEMEVNVSATAIYESGETFKNDNATVLGCLNALKSKNNIVAIMDNNTGGSYTLPYAYDEDFSKTNESMKNEPYPPEDY